MIEPEMSGDPSEATAGERGAGLTGRTRPDPPDPLAVVVFVLDGTRYAVPLERTEHVLRMVAISSLPGAPQVLAGVINLHGSVVPVVDMRRRLGRPARAYGPAAHLLVVKSSRRTLALPADEVLGVQVFPAGSVAESQRVTPGLDAVAGIAALSGGLVFIRDLEAFLSADEERSLDQALAAP